MNHIDLSNPLYRLKPLAFSLKRLKRVFGFSTEKASRHARLSAVKISMNFHAHFLKGMSRLMAAGEVVR